MRNVTQGLGLRHRQNCPLRKSLMLGWLLPSFVGFLVLASPAEAAKLRYWRFDANQNQLSFSTEGGVQPTAQLIFNPTRLVIDLPGTSLGRTTRAQQLGGAIKAIRVGQFDDRTSRIVVEVADGYTLDPQQVQFQAASASEWTVQLPTPQRVDAAQPAIAFPSSTPERSPVSISASQSLGDNAADSNLASSNESATSNETSEDAIEIKSIELKNNGTLLAIKADGPLNYSSDWDRATGAYRIAIKNAKLDDDLRNPQLDAGGNLLWLRLQQEEPQTIVILAQPAAGVQITGLTQPKRKTLELQLQRTQQALVPPEGGSASLATPSPDGYIRTEANYPSSYPSPSTRGVPNNGRIVVIIDPGHGGGDSGAIGIRGIREKDIVLDISLQVAQLLEQQGLSVIMTRTDDREVELEPRVQLAERVNATIFVSIHANAIDMSRPEVNGIETYYYDSGLGLARTIHNSILQTTGGPDRRVRQARFYVIRKTSMPAVLVETGFVTGALDAPKLADAGYRQSMAQAIAAGIVQYLQQNRR